MRNLDTAQLTQAQRTAMQNIRTAIGLPGTGASCQKVIKLDELQNFFDTPSKKIGGCISESSHVSDLDTVSKIRDGLRLDYRPNGFIGEDEVAIIEFDMPAEVSKAVPNGTTYPQTGNGFTGTKNGQVIPETALIGGGINVPEGAKAYWLDSDGNKVLMGTFQNGAWIQ